MITEQTITTRLNNYARNLVNAEKSVALLAKAYGINDERTRYMVIERSKLQAKVDALSSILEGSEVY